MTAHNYSETTRTPTDRFRAHSADRFGTREKLTVETSAPTNYETKTRTCTRRTPTGRCRNFRRRPRPKISTPKPYARSLGVPLHASTSFFTPISKCRQSSHVVKTVTNRYKRFKNSRLVLWRKSSALRQLSSDTILHWQLGKKPNTGGGVVTCR